MVKAENTVVGIYGHKGAGKTTTMALFLFLDSFIFEKLRCNIFMQLENFEFLQGKDMIELTDKLNHSVIGIDELHEYADSRNSNSFQNKRVADFFLQSRHTSSDIYYTTQYKDQVDKRIRRITDIDIVSENLYIDSDRDGDDDMFQITISNRKRPDVKPKTLTYYAKPIFDIFDSTERVNPFVFTKKQEKTWEKNLNEDKEE